MFWPLSATLSKDSNERVSRPETRITKNYQYLSNDAHPLRIIVNEADFRICFLKARVEFGERFLDDEADQWIQPQTVFHFVFCEDECDCVAFEGIHTTVSNTKHEDHIIDAKWRSLHDWFLEHKRIMRRTCDFARELVEVRARRDLELGEDPVVVEVEDEEEEEECVWVEREEEEDDGEWLGGEDWEGCEA